MDVFVLLAAISKIRVSVESMVVFNEVELNKSMQIDFVPDSHKPHMRIYAILCGLSES